MPSPGQTISINDPGLGIATPATSTPCFVGGCSSGTANVLKSHSSPTDLRAEFGEGPVVEDAVHCLAVSGGPVRLMKMTTSVAAAISAVTPTRVSTSTGTIPTSGTPNDDYAVEVEIMTTGTVGVGTFKYTLERNRPTTARTYSEVTTIPAGGAFLIPNTGVTITFTPGGGPIFFEKGDKFSFDTTAAMWNATNLGTAVTALLADSTLWNFLIGSGKHATGAAAATIFAALGTHLTSFANVHRYVGAMMDAGKDIAATTISAFAAVSDRRILAAYGDCDITSSKPFAGWGAPRRPVLGCFGAAAARNLISTDLARFASGPLPGVLEITHDDYKLGAIMDDAKISALRTFPGIDGFFIHNAKMKSPAGSDFQFWQHRRIMDEACRVTYEAQLRYLSAGLRTKADGTVDERDAARIEADITAKLQAALLTPKNAEGTTGHVSALAYRISRTHPLLTTNQLNSEVAVRPFGYPKFIVTQLGYAANVQQAAA